MIACAGYPAARKAPAGYRYLVTLRPNVSIAPRRFVREVSVDGPRPFEAVRKALELFQDEDTHAWQSDHLQFDVERVA